MDPIVIAFVVSVPAAFAAGVLFHKYVASEATSIKEHVTAEVAEVRADVAAALQRVAGKL